MLLRFILAVMALVVTAWLTGIVLRRLAAPVLESVTSHACISSCTHGALLAMAVASPSRHASCSSRIAGASAYAPEHTLRAYRLALEQGADFVEQDLAITRDGVLVCLHDPTLERTTDVEQVFPDRFRQTGWRAALVCGGLHARRDQAAGCRRVVRAEVRRRARADVSGSDRSGPRQGRAVSGAEVAGRLSRSRHGHGAAGRRGAAARTVSTARAPIRATPLILQSFDQPALQALARDLPIARSHVPARPPRLGTLDHRRRA